MVYMGPVKLPHVCSLTLWVACSVVVVDVVVVVVVVLK